MRFSPRWPPDIARTVRDDLPPVRILVTGATGFVGTGLVARLLRDGRHTRAIVRRSAENASLNVDQFPVGDISADTDWRAAMLDVGTVVHLAARVHIMRESAADPMADFRRTNVGGTLALANQAAASGVRRFVYVSSVKVNGEAGLFRESDQANPTDPYGISKYEAEVGLRAIAGETGLEVVIVRPPLVYGPGVGANFRALMQAVRRGVPLPFGAVNNRRSLIARDNLVDFIVTCVDEQAAANQTFLVSDGQDLSTPDLIRRIAHAMGRRARLFPVPVAFMKFGGAAIGRRAMFDRLLGSLQLDITKARSLLAWSPPVSLDTALAETVAVFDDNPSDRTRTT